MASVYFNKPVDEGSVTALRYQKEVGLPELSKDELHGLRRSVLWAYRILLARGRKRKAEESEEINRDKFLEMYPLALRGFVANVPHGNSMQCLVIAGDEWYEAQDWSQFCEYSREYITEVADSVTVRMDGATYALVEKYLARKGNEVEVRGATANLKAVKLLVAAGKLSELPGGLLKKKSSTQVRLNWGKATKPSP